MTRAALAALVLASSASPARAEGEQTPMFGGSVIGSRTPEQPELAGVQLELAWWRGRIGVAIEGSQQWGLERDPTTVTTAGASARLLVYRGFMPSLLEPRDVELGIEVHGVVERAWWQDAANEAAPIRYGGGVAIRLRGGGDDVSTNLLAESRLFVRVLTSRHDRTELATREMTSPVAPRAQELGVVIGLGASWGGGHRRYVDRFRPRPLDTVVGGQLIRLQ
jgi:hypothetical protein